MKRGLSFVVALGVCLCALNVIVYGQEIRTGEAGAAGNRVSSTIIGITQLEELVRGAKLSRERLTTQQPENIALLHWGA